MNLILQPDIENTESFFSLQEFVKHQVHLSAVLHTDADIPS